VVGPVPQGLPELQIAWAGLDALQALWLPALLISLVGFVESVSVAQSLGLKRQERIEPDRELLGLGAANLASAASGGFPVTGCFARSVVNFAAGARTPFAGVVSALLMAIVIAGFTGLFQRLPHAVLAATIIVAVVSLIDVGTLRQAWQYDRADGLSLVATALGVLLLGVETGIVLGVALSLGALVWRSSRPHIAVVGRLPGTEHFRNVERHQVETVPGLLAVRVDESLFFPNAAVVEDRIESLVARSPSVRRVLLICSAVNQIDATGLGMLSMLERNLAGRGVALWLAEVKGPVMDRLADTELGQRLQGRIFLSVHEAFVQAAQPGQG
jgi:sulfate permease, SulP family